MEENKKKYPTSKHIFMFPFIIKNIEQSIKIIHEDSNWIADEFSIQKDMDYNEYHYFYPFVQELLYPDKNQKNPIISRYIRKFKTGKFHFEVKKEIKNDKFELEIPEEGIELIILKDFSIGILTFHCENIKRMKFEEILIINDFARHIYPQYLPTFEIDKNGDPSGSKTVFLPDSVSITLDGIPFTVEKFDYYKASNNIMKIRYASYISKLLKGIDIKHILDDRMFVVSYAINDAVCKKLQYFLPEYLSGNHKSTTIENEIFMETIDEWYRYCFMDGKSLTCQSAIMKMELIKKCTYHRWINWGTIWGITRYSLVALFGSDPPKFLVKHVSRHYCRMAQIWLLIRAILIKFADESSDLARKIRNPKQDDKSKILDEIKSLRERYITFINDVWFTEITPMEQGIEMYKIGLKQMELEKQKNDLRRDIEELFEYVQAENERENNQIEKEQTKKISKVTFIGAILLPIGVLAGVISVFPDHLNQVKLIIFSLPILVFWIFMFLYFRVSIKKKKNLYLFIIVFTLIAFLVNPIIKYSNELSMFLKKIFCFLF